MSDPWSSISAPDQATRIKAHRVDDRSPWNFFWAKDTERKCLLVLRHDPASTPRRRLPTLAGIEISDVDYDEGTSKILVFRLVDGSQVPIFEQLCRSIIDATVGAGSESEAVELAIGRTWRWHHLLRGGSSSELSEEEQKGLIGELAVLRDHLLPQISTSDALNAWYGPLGAPKDFEVGRVCIEAKARRGAARPFISISSEFQLDNDAVDELFLYVVDLSRAPETDATGVTLTDIAREIQNLVRSSDPILSELFDARLIAAGFDWTHNYAEFRWVFGRSAIYRVGKDFPALVSSKVPSGVSNVRYSLALAECERYAVPADALNRALTGDAHGV